MLRYIKQNKLYVSVVIIFFLIGLLMLHFFCFGDTIGADEFFSLSFANNTKDYLFLSKGILESYGESGWISGEFIRDTFSVQSGEQFAIMPIHRIIRGDVHPPLYFMALNVVSSFFIDKIVCTPGHAINILMGLLIVVFAYLITLKITNERYLSFIAPTFWIISEASYSTITYIRMYASLCALILMVVYFHIMLMKVSFQRELKPTKKNIYLLLIGGLTFCGTLTHYYFYILMFFAALVSCIYMLLDKDYKLLTQYIITNAFFEICSLCCWPYVVRHMTGSERGVQVQENVKSVNVSSLREKIVNFLDTISINVFNLHMLAVVIVLIVAFAILYFGVIRKNKRSAVESCLNNNISRSRTYPFVLIVVVELGYLLVLLIISYSSRWLYMSPTFAMLHISIALICVYELRVLNEKKINFVCITLVGIVLIVRAIVVISTNMQSRDFFEDRHSYIDSYTKNSDVLFLYEEWNNLFDNQIIEISDADEVGIVDINDLYTTDLKEQSNNRKSNDGIVVYLPKNIENDTEIIDYICHTMDYTDSTLIDDYSNKIYYLENK